MVSKYEKTAVDFPRLRQLMAARGIGAADAYADRLDAFYRSGGKL